MPRTAFGTLGGPPSVSNSESRRPPNRAPSATEQRKDRPHHHQDDPESPQNRDMDRRRRGAHVDWVRRTTRRGLQLYGSESNVSPIRLLRQGGDTSQPASGARSRRIGGVRARSAIRHTARYEGASGLSIPGSGL